MGKDAPEPGIDTNARSWKDAKREMLLQLQHSARTSESLKCMMLCSPSNKAMDISLAYLSDDLLDIASLANDLDNYGSYFDLGYSFPKSQLEQILAERSNILEDTFKGKKSPEEIKDVLYLLQRRITLNFLFPGGEEILKAAQAAKLFGKRIGSFYSVSDFGVIEYQLGKKLVNGPSWFIDLHWGRYVQMAKVIEEQLAGESYKSYYDETGMSPPTSILATKNSIRECLSETTCAVSDLDSQIFMRFGRIK